MLKRQRALCRPGSEYGSARWGASKDIIPYMDEEDPDNNMIITKTESLRLNGRPKSMEYAVNKNIMVIGGSGSGKTRFFVKPQLMQLHSSYIISDPKGQVLIETGKMLQQAGYVIKVIDTTDFDCSMHYNPFAYLRSEKDIMKLITILMAIRRECWPALQAHPWTGVPSPLEWCRCAPKIRWDSP